MIIRKLEVNGKTVVLTEDVIRELHRQEHIEEGKLMIERFIPDLRGLGIFAYLQ